MGYMYYREGEITQSALNWVMRESNPSNVVPAETYPSHQSLWDQVGWKHFVVSILITSITPKISADLFVILLRVPK